MSNNLTNLNAGRDIKKLYRFIIYSFLLGLLASCAGESSSGRDVSAKRGQVQKPGKQDCISTENNPCPTPVEQSQIVTTKGTVPAFTESSLGFYEASDSSIPAAVKAVAESSVKLIIPKGSLQTTQQIYNSITNSTSEENISNDDLLQKLQQEIDSAQEQSKKDELLGLQVQAQQCKQKNQTNCSLLKTIEVQSGFLVTQEDTESKKKSIVVVTTLDVIVNYIKEKYALTSPDKVETDVVIFTKNVLNKVDLPILIINNAGKVISGAASKINFSATDGRVNAAARKIHEFLKSSKQPDGTIVLRSANIEGTPLQMKMEAIELDSTEELFVAGFPHETKSRERNNADGKSLYFTKGKQVQVESVKKALGLNINIAKTEESKWIALSNDSNNGLKGSAIVNSQGALIGIVSHSKAESANSDNAELAKRSTLGLKSNSEWILRSTD